MYVVAFASCQGATRIEHDLQNALAGHRVLDSLASIEAHSLAMAFRTVFGRVLRYFKRKTSIPGLILILREVDDTLKMLMGQRDLPPLLHRLKDESLFIVFVSVRLQTVRNHMKIM